MVFQVDNQTLEDLDIVGFGKRRTNVSDLFDRVRSLKGKERLQFFLKHPLTDYDMINGRLNVIRFFQNLTCKCVYGRFGGCCGEKFLLSGGVTCGSLCI